MLSNTLLVINMILCLGIAWSCSCRLDMSSKKVKLLVRNRYTIIGTGALFGAFGRWVFPFWGGDGIGLIVFVGAVAVGFLMDKVDWEHGVPHTAIKGNHESKSKTPSIPQK